MDPRIKALIDHFDFQPLPAEGTFFSSTWRSTREFSNGSPVGTAMIGMYSNDPLSQSLFHRLPADEVWHFYGGDPFRLVLLFPDGHSCDVVMGNDPLRGQHVQYVVKAGTWQAAHLIDGGLYALFGCTMAPGFMGSMYEGARRSDLLAAYPGCRNNIMRLTDEDGETQMPQDFAR